MPLSDALPTYAPPRARTPAAQIRAATEALQRVPLLQTLLDAFPDPAAVVDENRQVVMINRGLADMAGTRPGTILGLRPGEVLACVRASEAQECGLANGCLHCGAGQALYRTGAAREDATRDWSLTYETPDGPAALDLRVRTTPLRAEGRDLAVVTFRDVTDEKRRQVLERLFFHDVLNTAGGLQGLLALLPELDAGEAADVGRLARGVADQLIEEIEAQRDLAAAERGDLRVGVAHLFVPEILGRVRSTYAHHATAEGKRVVVDPGPGEPVVTSDPRLLARVLGNLLKNALEASAVADTVTVRFVPGAVPRFEVHNPGVMADDVQRQMFQRSFSTKAAAGRGIGTYSAKLLTERYLGGRIGFRSAAPEGTTFVVELLSSR